MALYSERAGRNRTYSANQLYHVLTEQLESWDMQRLMLHSLGGTILYDNDEDPDEPFDFEVEGVLTSAKAYFRRKLVHDMHFHTENAYNFLNTLPANLSPLNSGNLDLFLDFLELLFELVENPQPDAKMSRLYYSKKNGRDLYRELINPDLMLYARPMRMLANGQIVEISNKPVIELAEDGLEIIESEKIDKNIKEAVSYAIKNYLDRDASVDDKKSAVVELTGALESMRGKVKLHLLSRDEKDLFDIANNFAIRHNNSKQKAEYDKEIWYDWMFHVNLAALLTVLRIVKSQDD